jgi:hypothetical protein
LLEPGWGRPDPGLWAGGGVDEPDAEEVLDVLLPVPVVPVPVVPVPVVPVPVVLVPVVPVPVVPVPVVPVPVVPVVGGELLGMRYDKGAANGMSPDWPKVAMIVPPAPMNCPVLGRNTAGWVDPSPR